MKIHELLDKPEKWTKYESARDKDGVGVRATSPKAVCWCFFGALVRCYNLKKRSRIEIRIHEELKTTLYIWWNDSHERTYEEVLALCKKLDI